MPPPALAPRLSNNPALIVLIALAAVVALSMATVTGYVVYARFIREDTGITACKTMPKAIKYEGRGEDKGDPQISVADYHKLRKAFEHSRYPDIKQYGTGLVDVLWEVSNLPRDGSSLGFLAPFMTNVMGFQTACANQGVRVNLHLMD